MKKRLPPVVIFLLFPALLAAVMFASVFIGRDLNISEVAAYFIQKIPFIGDSLAPDQISVALDRTMQLALPRILLSAIVGAGLAWSGAVFQALFKNPLADPYFLGVSAGASFGSTLVTVLVPAAAVIIGLSLSSLAAFIFALLSVFSVYLLARQHGRIPLANLLLAGIAVSAVLTALVSGLMLMASEQLKTIVLYTMGTFSRASWEKVQFAYPAIIASMLVTYFFARDLNQFLFGEEHAAGLGVDVEKRKRLLLVLTSLASALCVATSGIIWFVGLIVPHMMRLITGPDNRRLLPASAFGGALLLVVSDALCRTLFPPEEIPIGILTALAGAPFFIYLLQKNKRSAPGSST
jgi:iron complex transport system permease protein